uniref:Beta-1,4-galactosyltransferase n=1 Tax=Leptobrachium leishanense TaxID=445787 RepID=A0A8C5PGA6_9ANUR
MPRPSLRTAMRRSCLPSGYGNVRAEGVWLRRSPARSRRPGPGGARAVTGVCREVSGEVGPLAVVYTKPPSLKTIQSRNPYVTSGGYFSPKHCYGRYRTAVIIPHRNREMHLRYLLYYLHPFLQRQQLHYAIFVVHQAGNGTFNRAKLLNVGVREALRLDDWDCLILHDVDLVPENDYNLYVCDEYNPKHLASAMDKFHYKLPYWEYFGGVSALTPDQYMRINGFPNSYWGWGGEDDDIAARVRLAGMSISRSPHNLGRYKMIMHDRDTGNEENVDRYKLLDNTRRTWKDDGMNALTFSIISREAAPLYTNITVDIGTPPPPRPTGTPKKWSFF